MRGRSTTRRSSSPRARAHPQQPRLVPRPRPARARHPDPGGAAASIPIFRSRGQHWLCHAQVRPHAEHARIREVGHTVAAQLATALNLGSVYDLTASASKPSSNTSSPRSWTTRRQAVYNSRCSHPRTPAGNARRLSPVLRREPDDRQPELRQCSRDLARPAIRNPRSDSAAFAKCASRALVRPLSLPFRQARGAAWLDERAPLCPSLPGQLALYQREVPRSVSPRQVLLRRAPETSCTRRTLRRSKHVIGRRGRLPAELSLAS